MGNFIINYFKDAFDDKAHSVYLRSTEAELNSVIPVLVKYSIKVAAGAIIGEISSKLLDYLRRGELNIKSTLYVLDEELKIKPEFSSQILVKNIDTLQIPYKDIIQVRGEKANFMYSRLFISTINGDLKLLGVSETINVIIAQISRAIQK